MVCVRPVSGRFGLKQVLSEIEAMAKFVSGFKHVFGRSRTRPRLCRGSSGPRQIRSDRIWASVRSVNIVANENLNALGSSYMVYDVATYLVWL